LEIGKGQDLWNLGTRDWKTTLQADKRKTKGISRYNLMLNTDSEPGNSHGHQKIDQEVLKKPNPREARSTYRVKEKRRKVSEFHAI